MNPLVVDNTMLSTFRVCRRKGFYFIRKGYRPPLTAAPLNFGAVIHSAIAHYLIHKDKEAATVIALRSWRATPEDPDEWRTPEKMVEVLDSVYNNLDFEVVLGKDGTPMVEIEFALPLFLETERDEMEIVRAAGFEGVLYAGIIDLVTKWMQQYFVVDHKTSSYFYRSPKGGTPFVDPKYFDRFKPEAATAGYCWAMNQVFGEPMAGMIINAIGIPKTGKNPIVFSKNAIPWSAEELEEWRQDTVMTIVQLCEAIIKDKWPKCTESCWKFNSPCNYLTLCKTPPSIRDGMLGLYEVRPWNPLEERKKEREALE